MKIGIRMALATIGATLALTVVAFAATIEQANVLENGVYKPAVKIDGIVYETPYRFGTTAEAEQWVLATLGISATAQRNIGGVDEDAAGNLSGSGSGF